MSRIIGGPRCHPDRGRQRPDGGIPKSESIHLSTKPIDPSIRFTPSLGMTQRDRLRPDAEPHHRVVPIVVIPTEGRTAGGIRKLDSTSPKPIPSIRLTGMTRGDLRRLPDAEAASSSGPSRTSSWSSSG